MTTWTYRKCPFAVVFASLTSLTWSCFHNLISLCSRDLSHSWGAEMFFSFFLRGAHCFGLKALLIWLTLIIILSIFSSKKQLFVMNPAQLTVAVQDFTPQNQGNKRKSIYIAEFKNYGFIPITSCVLLSLSCIYCHQGSPLRRLCQHAEKANVKQQKIRCSIIQVLTDGDWECVKNAAGTAGWWLTETFARSDEDNVQSTASEDAMCLTGCTSMMLLMHLKIRSFFLFLFIYLFFGLLGQTHFDQSVLYWWDVTVAAKAMAANLSPADTVCSHTDWWLTWFCFVRIKDRALGSWQEQPMYCNWISFNHWKRLNLVSTNKTK